MITVNKKSLTSLLTGMLVDPSILEEMIVSGISMDSRNVEHNWLFLSLAKDKSQRLKYLGQAIKAGAKVVLYEQQQDLTSSEITVLAKQNVAAYAVKNLADKAGEIAARFYGHPSLALTLIAVTGTNGKTSVSQFIAQSLERLSLPCGIIGTLGVGRINALDSTGMTTPDPVRIQGILAELCQRNINYVVIEASSHALQQGRLNSVNIDVAVLTNLSRDHLDYHKNMNNYAEAKAQLFDVASVKTAVINSADNFGKKLLTRLSDKTYLKVWSFNSKNKNADYYAENYQASLHGITFDLVHDNKTTKIESSLIGRFNVDNLLATFASLIAVGISFEKASDAIEHCQCVEGRMQTYSDQQHAQCVVDFAHTPDALMQALKSLREHLPVKGLLWCVFGCGGDRDKGKRAEMGHCAEQYADKVIITNDNPRYEDPEAIIEDILSGIEQPENVHIKYDRKQAIIYAMSHASMNDIVLVAGKGHEQYQDISGVKQVFSDSRVVTEYLAANDGQTNTMRVGL